MQELGTRSSWVRDGALAGFGFALFGWGWPLTAVLSLGEQPNWHNLQIVIPVSLAGGLLLGALAGGVCLSAARRRLSLALLAGTALGALGTSLVAFVGMSLLPHAPGFALLELPLVPAFGALAALPVVGGYTFVRAKGRSGLPVLFAGAIWVLVPDALAFIGSEML